MIKQIIFSASICLALVFSTSQNSFSQTKTKDGQKSSVPVSVSEGDYGKPITSSRGSYYYLSKLESAGGIENIMYSKDYAKGGLVDVYKHVLETSLKVKKTAGRFTLKVWQGYPDAVTALWIDWNMDGVFSNNYFVNKVDPTDELIEPLFGTPKKNNPGELVVTVNIPSDAKIGKTRMRFQTTWKGDSEYDVNLYPQGDIGTSSVRDFDIEIIE